MRRKRSLWHPGGVDARRRVAAMLAKCYPLHPLTAMMLGPLFRQLAQNERSLFAFLASSEPFGFQEFLREQHGESGPYRLDHLYDYVMTSLGTVPLRPAPRQAVGGSAVGTRPAARRVATWKFVLPRPSACCRPLVPQQASPLRLASCMLP